MTNSERVEHMKTLMNDLDFTIRSLRYIWTDNYTFHYSRYPQDDAELQALINESRKVYSDAITALVKIREKIFENLLVAVKKSYQETYTC